MGLVLVAAAIALLHTLAINVPQWNATMDAGTTGRVTERLANAHVKTG